MKIIKLLTLFTLLLLASCTNVAGTSTSNGYLYVALTNGPKILVVSASRQAIVKSINLPSVATDIQAQNNGNYIYALCPDAKRFYVIDPTTGNPLSRFHLPQSFNHFTQGLPGSPDVYLFNSLDGSFLTLNVVTGAESDVYKLGSNPVSMAIKPPGLNAYIIDSKGGLLELVHLTDNSLFLTIPVGPESEGVVIPDDGQAAYVLLSLQGEILVINLYKNTIERGIPVGSNASAEILDNKYLLLFVLNNKSDTITPVDLVSNTTMPATLTGKSPANMTLSTDQNYLFITNKDADSVSQYQVNPTTGASLIDTIYIGASPGPIAFLPQD
jgi:DNA-binding beta-propeller fold protein YncE